MAILVSLYILLLDCVSACDKERLKRGKRLRCIQPYLRTAAAITICSSIIRTDIRIKAVLCMETTKLNTRAMPTILSTKKEKNFPVK